MMDDDLTRVRKSGVRNLLVEVVEFDPVPCRMRLSIPGKSRIVHPVPGRPDGVDANRDVLVWCECMAQTWEQLMVARRVAAGTLDPSVAVWPAPRQTRGWDVIGAVATVLDEPYAASTRGRRSNPDAHAEVIAMYRAHVAERQARLAHRAAMQAEQQRAVS